ncbi:hypothetical protein CVT24_004335 [Panaeolus cyanescens]|uniref:Nudix hydrolase domain-containing protein n=1 Tax=Panaeolus cyanescens TaxID=181874 RepID=A0A409VAA4_9AGAR|nr:hypothetical protein CVT24_004335 [Panaeolus cyanescens]
MASSSSSSPEVPPAGPVPVNSLTRYSYEGVTKAEVLEDLSSRFILNLPDEELNQVERVSFQVEQAHWFYEDFIREQNDKLPSLSLKAFSRELFIACPLLHPWRDNHEQAFEQFMAYKTRVPVCGAIMLNSTLDKCVLVKGYKSGSGWGFPKGKINEGEPRPACAVREVLEETGHNLAGLIDPENVIEMTIKEQKISLFIVPNVPEDTVFETRTRKEISDIAWFKLADLPTWKRNKTVAGKFYLISPFIGPLKKFIYEYKAVQKNRNKQKAKKVQSQASAVTSATSQVSPVPVKSLPLTEPKLDEVTNSTPLDPHLARLLTSLAQSSLAPPASNSETHAIPAQSPGPIAEAKPSTINQSSAAPNNQPSLPKDTSAHQISSPPRSDDHIVKPAIPASNLQVSGISLKQNADASASSNLDRNSSNTEVVSIPESPTSSVRSNRRSSTADISPYLTKAVEVPTSAKRLKQISLLESVADESARMAPLIAARAAMASRGPIPTSYPQPSPSVPPQPIIMQHALHGMPGTLSGQPYRFPNHHLYSNAMPEHDHFQLRSRTSQAVNRAPIHNTTGSVNIKQNQLLNSINGARGIPAEGSFPPLHQPRPMMDPSQFHLPPPHMLQQPPLSTPSTVHITPNPLPQQNPGINPMLDGRPMPPAALPSVAPSLHNPSTVSLLSILNSKPNYTGSFPSINGLR